MSEDLERVVGHALLALEELTSRVEGSEEAFDKTQAEWQACLEERVSEARTKVEGIIESCSEKRATLEQTFEDTKKELNAKVTEVESAIASLRSEAEGLKDDIKAMAEERAAEEQRLQTAMAAAKAHREEEEERIKKLHERFMDECESEIKNWTLQRDSEKARLVELKNKEEQIKERVAATLDALREGGRSSYDFEVGGQRFVISADCLMKFPHSVLARLCDEQHRRQSEGPVTIDRDPTHFGLLIDYLRTGQPMIADTSQIRWLEREAEYYGLDQLVVLCRSLYKRLDSVKVKELLNGQRNLAGMDMRGLDLSCGDFRGANMYRALMDDAVLTDAVVSARRKMKEPISSTRCSTASRHSEPTSRVRSCARRSSRAPTSRRPSFRWRMLTALISETPIGGRQPGEGCPDECQPAECGPAECQPVHRRCQGRCLHPRQDEGSQVAERPLPERHV